MRAQKAGNAKFLHSFIGSLILLALIAAVQLVLPGEPHEIVSLATSQGGSWVGVMLVVGVLLVPWLRSVLLRCPDPLIRRNIVIIATILSLWMLVVAIKYETSSDLLCSILWYCYYAPFCLIPALALECAVYVANLDKAKGLMRAVKFVSYLSLLLVVTNNVHHFVFRFSFDDANWASDYTYNVGYALVVAWIVLVMGAFVITLYYSAHRTRRRTVVLLLVLLGFAAVYGALYVFDMLPGVLRNIAFFYCLFIVLTVEFCLRTGQLPSYSRYEQAFQNLPFDVRAFDWEKHAVLHSSKSEEVSDELIATCLPASQPISGADYGILQLSEDRIVGKYAHVAGGYVVVVENVTELERQRLELTARRSELHERMEVLSSSREVESRLCRLQAESELCEEIEVELSHAVAKIRSLLDALPSTKDERAIDERQRMLFQVKLLLSYCKRQGGLVLASEDVSAFSEERLSLALSETVEDLRTSGVECAALPEISGEVPINIVHDLYECLYLLGGEALAMSEPQMMVFISGGQKCPVLFRIALESDSVKGVANTMIENLRNQLGSLSVSYDIFWDDTVLYLVAAEGEADE